MISFVIPAHNEERLLPRTIGAIRLAADELGVAYEVVVADDASEDGTGRVAESCGARVVRSEARQIAAARNAGALAARGDLLLFVDADTVVSPEVVRAAVEGLRGGAVGGGALVDFDGVVPARLRGALAVFMRIYFHLKLAAGCFVFCTREAFDAVGGFDERLFAGEEAALSAALKRRGRFLLLQERVLTSGRKLRAYSLREIIFSLLLAAPWRGRGGDRRKGLEIWYERRPDPGGTTPTP